MPTSSDPAENDASMSKHALAVPESVMKMWYIGTSKTDYDVKKVSENDTAVAYVNWNSKTNKLRDSLGRELTVYKTFTDAEIHALKLRFQDKKKKWDAHVKASMVLNDQMSEIMDQISILEGLDQEDEEGK